MEILTIQKYLNIIKSNRPLILNITNEVTVNNVANIEILIGASPIMSSNLKDCIELLDSVHSIVINLGTLDPIQCKLAKKLCIYAKNKNIPIILDIVGYGATKARNKIFNTLIPFSWIIKGNASEISSLYYQKSYSKGVDNLLEYNNDDQINYQQMVNTLAIKYKKIIVITGKIDYISDGKNTLINTYENHFLTQITGTGCMLNGVIAGFIDKNNILDSILAAITFFTLSASLDNMKDINNVQNFWIKWQNNMEFF